MLASSTTRSRTNQNRYQKTLKFVNGEATSVHGCVRASSVFTSESGEWKLAGFDVLSSVKDDDAIIYVCALLSSMKRLH
jgi:hypothetical protein